MISNTYQNVVCQVTTVRELTAAGGGPQCFICTLLLTHVCVCQLSTFTFKQHEYYTCDGRRCAIIDTTNSISMSNCAGFNEESVRYGINVFTVS